MHLHYWHGLRAGWVFGCHFVIGRYDDDMTHKKALGMGDGLRAFGGGIGFIISTPPVWGYALVPALMMLLLATIFSALGLWGASWATDAIMGRELGTWGQVGSWALYILLCLLALLLAILLALSLAQPLSGFALEAIAHAQEHALTGRKTPPPSFLASMWSNVKVVLVALVVGMPILILLFAIEIVFPPAALVVIPLKLLVCGWLLAWDFIDYPLSIHGHGIRNRLKWVGRNFGAFTVFGLVWSMLLIVPGMVLLILPMGIAGATRLVVADADATLAKLP